MVRRGPAFGNRCCENLAGYIRTRLLGEKNRDVEDQTLGSTVAHVAVQKNDLSGWAKGFVGAFEIFIASVEPT